MATADESTGYRVVLTPAALRDFDDLPSAVRPRIDARLQELGQNPRRPGVIKLAGSDDLYRSRVGDYRILFRIDDAARLVEVARIRHRRDVYR